MTKIGTRVYSDDVPKITAQLAILFLLSFFIVVPNVAIAYTYPSSSFDLRAYMESIRAKYSSRISSPQENPPIYQPSPTPRSISSPVFANTPTPRPNLQTNKSTPKPTASNATNSSVKDFIMNAINNYRSSLGLSRVQTDPYTCGFSQTRAKEISTDFSHSGFQSRINNHTLPYPSYHYITENIAMTSNYQQVVQMWINSPGHAENMRADTPYVCVERYGNYYAYEGWKP